MAPKAADKKAFRHQASAHHLSVDHTEQILAGAAIATGMAGTTCVDKNSKPKNQ